MSELIERSHLATSVAADDWKDAIRCAGRLLEETGDILPAYVDEMIEGVLALGPYIVIAPGLALAHSAPSPSVKRTSASLVTLDWGVSFGCDNDPVRIVICLACVDKTSHIAELQKMARFLMSPGAMDGILACDNPDELYEFINSCSVEDHSGEEVHGK